MSFEYGFYNSLDGDRLYSADKLSAYFSGLFTRGVCANYLNSLRVVIVSGRFIGVEPGKLFFSDGHFCHVTEMERRQISASDDSLNRIDRVVIRHDKSNSVRGCEIYVKTGTPAATPAPPALESDSDVEEISLAQVLVSAVSQSLTLSDITDERANTSVCGWSHVQGEELIEETYTSFDNNVITNGVVIVSQKNGWCQVSGAVVLNGPVSDWTTILGADKVPVPEYDRATYQTVPTYGSTYQRPTRVRIGAEGGLQVCNGAAYQVNFSITYPVL